MYATPMLLRRAASWGLAAGPVAASSARSSARRKMETRAMLSVLVIGSLGMILSECLVRELGARMPSRIARTPCEAHRGGRGMGSFDSARDDRVKNVLNPANLLLHVRPRGDLALSFLYGNGLSGRNVCKLV